MLCSRSAGTDEISTPPLRAITACCSSAERAPASLTMKEAEVKTGGRSDTNGAVGVLSPLATMHAMARIAIAGITRRHLAPVDRRPTSENACRTERLVDKTFLITWTFMPDPFIYRMCGDSSWKPSIFVVSFRTHDKYDRGTVNRRVNEKSTKVNLR